MDSLQLRVHSHPWRRRWGCWESDKQGADCAVGITGVDLVSFPPSTEILGLGWGVSEGSRGEGGGWGLLAAPGDPLSKAEFPTEVEGHGSALDLERALLHFSNVGSTKLKTVFPNPRFSSFFKSLCMRRERRDMCFSFLHPRNHHPLSPPRSPMSPKPLETVKPFHPLFKRGPRVLLKTNEGGGFQSRQKAFLPARLPARLLPVQSRATQAAATFARGEAVEKSAPACRRRGLQRRALRCQVVKIVKG